MPGFFETTRAYATLARWLGPWSGDDEAPRDVAVADVTVAGSDGEFVLRRFTPANGRATGSYLIAPGLHFAGPANPRMDRFCRILAAAGYRVACPFLPDYVALRVTPRALDDFSRCLDAELADPPRPGAVPAVFSISFGSLLALRLAAARQPDVAALICFGGYADWAQTIHFSLTGEIDAGDGPRPYALHDPLNRPAVFINLIDDLDGRPPDPAPLIDAWLRFCKRTWGRDEMKTGDRHLEVAREIAAGVPAAARELFLVGCGALPGGVERCAAALARAGERTRFVDPRPHLPAIRCPVHIVHGVDDDVIPYSQAEALAAALPPSARARVHLTGLYGHTKAAQSHSPAAAARELVSMARILRAIVAPAR